MLIENLEEFLEQMKDKGCTECTIKTYEQSVGILVSWLERSRSLKNWSQVTEKDLARWIRYLRTERKNKAKTSCLRITVIKAFFKFLKKEGEIDANPAID